jgi:hypothetical protein
LRRTDFKTGHCSLVAVLGHPQNTEALIPAATDWASFLDLVRDTKNVAWRNFHVVEVCVTATRRLATAMPVGKCLGPINSHLDWEGRPISTGAQVCGRRVNQVRASVRDMEPEPGGTDGRYATRRRTHGGDR